MQSEDARKIALSMPDAVEGAHHGHPDFRIGKRIFATLRPGDNRSVLRLPLEIAENLERESPEKYRLVSRSNGGWLSVQLGLEKQLEFQELMEMAHSYLLATMKK